jgi:integration host factor subunit alpha
MTITKADIVEGVHQQVGIFSRKEAAELVELVFEILKETLGKGDKVKISGFGNFVVRHKKARKGRNPQTGKEITISERNVLTFQVSPVLKEMMNNKKPGGGAAGGGGAGTAGGSNS